MNNSTTSIDRDEINDLALMVHGDKFSDRPPYHIVPLLRKHNVAELQEAEIDFDGYVIARGNYFVIGYNRNHHKHRIRFTCAHELAHILIDKDLKKNRFRQNSQECSIDIWEQDSNEEILCNKIAAALLLPEDIFKKYVEHLEPSFSSLMKLSKIFYVSKDVILRQIMDLNLWDINVIHWLPLDQEWPDAGYYVKRSWTCGNQKLLLKTNQRISATTRVHDTYTKMRYSREAFSHNIVMESRLVRGRFEQYVQSILIQRNATI